MKFYNYKRWLSLGGIFLLLFTFSELSAVTSESPLAVIQARNNTIKEIIDSAGETIDDQTREKLKDIINELIDFRELSRLALGKYWKERTEKEKEEFTTVFRDLIRNSSVKKLEVYRADQIKYDDPLIDDDKATVTTKAYKGRKNVEIVYKMHQVGGEWKIYDMIIDGMSTAQNYRGSFYKQIAKTSYQEMYDKLVKRLSEEKES